jgi:hypothetical protein
MLNKVRNKIFCKRCWSSKSKYTDYNSFGYELDTISGI